MLRGRFLLEPIRSRDNTYVKELAGLLGSRKNRDRAGLFALEGLRLCLDAAGSGLPVKQLFLTPRAAARWPETEELVRAAERTLWITEELAGRIADTKSTQGIFCICPKLDNQKCAVTIKGSGKYLLLHQLQDPGNLGTILRAAQAMGVDGVFADGCPDLYAPKVLRASMGSLFRLPVSDRDAAEAVIARLEAAGVPVYAAALAPGARPVDEADLSGGCAVLIGNEGDGLPDGLIRACAAAVVIPMAPGADSLNAASAAAILLWEMTRKRP